MLYWRNKKRYIKCNIRPFGPIIIEWDHQLWPEVKTHIVIVSNVEHCIIANKEEVSNIQKCILVDPSIIHPCVQYTYIFIYTMCTYMYSSSQGFSKRERLEYIHIYIYYICVCNIHIFTCTVRELGEREKETGMPPWAGPGTGRETRAGFLVRLDSKL